MYIKTIAQDMQTVFEQLEQQIKGHGMLLLCHINGQANAAKIGEQVPAVRVIEVFRPEFAVRVWRTEQKAGIEIPVRLYLYEDPEGNTVIMRRSLSDAFAKYELDTLSQVGHEADAVMESIVSLTAKNLQPQPIAE